MRFTKVEHIGIAVLDIHEATQRYTLLLGSSPYREEEVPSEGVRTVFFKMGETKIELLASTRPDSPITKFLEKKGEGIHHIAYRSENIWKDMEDLKNAGYQLLHEKPINGAECMLVCFIHPRNCNGVLTELCQPQKESGL